MVMTMTVNEIGEYSHSKLNFHRSALRISFLPFRFTLCHYEKSFAFISYGPHTALRVRRRQNNTNRPNPNQSNQSITTLPSTYPAAYKAGKSPGKKIRGKGKKDCSSKSSYKCHSERTGHNIYTCYNSFPPCQYSPTFVAEKVFCEELHKAGEYE